MAKRNLRLDLNRNAFRIVAEATGTATPKSARAKNPAAVELGRLGGLKGGKARAEKLSKQELSNIGKKAAMARWKRRDGTS